MLLLLLAALSDPPKQPALPPQKCQRADNNLAGDTAVVRIRPLTEEPPARREAAVAYKEGGCLKPVMLLKGGLQKLPEPE